MLEGNSPNCSRLPHRYAISSPFFAAYFIISSAVLTDLFFDATNFSSHHNNCDTVSLGGEKRGGSAPSKLCFGAQRAPVKKFMQHSSTRRTTTAPDEKTRWRYRRPSGIFP